MDLLALFLFRSYRAQLLVSVNSDSRKSSDNNVVSIIFNFDDILKFKYVE